MANNIHISRNIRMSVRAIILALTVCMAMQMTSFVIIMPLFARRFSAFGAGVEALGLSSMAYAVTSTLAAPFMGSLADRYGRRPVVLGSLAVYVFAFTGYLLVQSSAVFILLRGLAGALTAGLIPAVMGIIADIAPTDRRGQYIGIVNGGASIGWIIGPLIGGYLYDRWGYGVPFVLSVAIALLTLLIALFTVPETHTRSAEQPNAALLEQKAQARAGWHMVLNSSLRSLPTPLLTFGLLLAVSFCVMFAWAFIEPELMFYVYDDLDWSRKASSLFLWRRYGW